MDARLSHLPIVVMTLWLTACMGFSPLRHDDYATAARLNYDRGVTAMERSSHEVAEKYFVHVRTSYPFSNYAAMAELRIADTLFKRDQLPEAAGAFEVFAETHPGHPCALYGRYMAGVAYQLQAPEEWWFMPPAYERDQSYTESAAAIFRDLVVRLGAAGRAPAPIRDTGDIPLCTLEEADRLLPVYAGDIVDRRNRCLLTLAGRELYAADFYQSRDKPRGAVLRLEGVLARYPELDGDDAFLLRLGGALSEAGTTVRAREVLERVAGRGGPLSGQARQRLESLSPPPQAEAAGPPGTPDLPPVETSAPPEPPAIPAP